MKTPSRRLRENQKRNGAVETKRSGNKGGKDARCTNVNDEVFIPVYLFVVPVNLNTMQDLSLVHIQVAKIGAHALDR